MSAKNIDIKNCRAKVLGNIDSDEVNMHSFFIRDLEKAKNIDTNNLNDYLFRVKKKRVNLDCRLNKEIINDILQPKNYPIARYPDNPEYELSLMQQVAVNLAIGYDDEKIRSVNGPPGTGKTTLLRDIFTQLVVEQAYVMANMQDKFVKGDETTVYYKDKGKIGILPKEITDRGIVVASSNNSAVQNIVQELPLISKVDDEFIDELLEADYFLEIANPKKDNKKESKEDEKNSLFEKESDEDLNEEHKYWGLFSMEGGRKANMSRIISKVRRVQKYLENEYQEDKSVYDEFLKQYDEICAYRNKKQDDADKVNEYRLLNTRSDNSEINKTVIEELDNFNLKVEEDIGFDINDLNDELDKLQSSINEIKNKTKQSDNLNTDDIQDLKQYVDNIDNKFDFEKDYKSLQLSNPWFDIEYRRMQTRLFIQALRVRKQFLYDNVENVKASLHIWENDKYPNVQLYVEAWNWINLVIPVISSTFASISNMFANLGKEKIGHLFIDEAGQALPQASVGAIFRSKNVMAVGDPAQIKPVLTLDSNILEMLRKYFNVDSCYLSEDASTQSLIDETSKYGFYKDKEEEEWIGIPLWVHRRCLKQMFEIANKISYGGNMVQEKDTLGKVKWYDIKGKANNKYVKEQGEFLVNKLKEMIDNNPDIINKKEKDIVYVITPFKNVADQLAKELKKIKFIREDKGKPTNVGTVHTFQGKEAKIVFLVLGADDSSTGAARWAMGSNNPNIMNVAATRAKEEFYIIGDKDLYLSLDSDVINDTNMIIEKYDEVDKTK